MDRVGQQRRSDGGVACMDGDRDMTGQKGLRDDMIGDVWIIR